jgi:uncharacterized protein YndB with AHSA1/START domain
MKLKAQVIIDADQATVWQFLKQPDAIKQLVGEVSEERKPDLLMGLWQGERSNAVVVNHVEKLSDQQTRYIAYWNHTFKGARKLAAVFAHNKMQARLQDQLDQFKLRVETGVANAAD